MTAQYPDGAENTQGPICGFKSNGWCDESNDIREYEELNHNQAVDLPDGVLEGMVFLSGLEASRTGASRRRQVC
ncbi:hypothetical protein HPP92_003045 [Vanilla planifolia]|uniref:Uncharacterized protein n=1 Tax=Vanilla planifolia TaxID=51239 RepID=A0A835VF30_VANPL|nr:hypothetical protein HPP92_003045 [Vanilla planifolia]